MMKLPLFFILMLMISGCSSLDAVKSAAGFISGDSGEGPSASLEVGDDEASVGSDEARTESENENEISDNQGTVTVSSDTVTEKETSTQSNEVKSIESQENVFEDGIPWYWAIALGILVPFPTPRKIWRRLTGKKPNK